MNRRISMAVQMHLFRRIERKLNPSRITGIFLDEARRMIGDDLFAATAEGADMLAGTRLTEWLARIVQRPSMIATRPPEALLKAA